MAEVLSINEAAELVTCFLYRLDACTAVYLDDDSTSNKI
jgi:hypothetical protein